MRKDLQIQTFYKCGIMSIWNDKEFVRQWNETYGLDMSKAPIRPGVIFPLIDARIAWPNRCEDAIKIADFGCGNGNFIRAFLNRPFVNWLGIDNGEAVLATAEPLSEDNRSQGNRVAFLKRDISREMPNLPSVDHAVSIFTLEEIPTNNVSVFFDNLAQAVCERSGKVHIFTQHPSYAHTHDIVSNENGVNNEKFPGYRGYFDAAPTTYQLTVLNGESGISERPVIYHKPLAMIVNGLAKAGLYLREMLEIPVGVITMESLRSHQPTRGDVPRFLYLLASHRL